MNEKKSIQKILLIGAGPTRIGQAGFFESGALNACRALREEGCRVVVLNSDPASLLADSGLADKVYLEPLTSDVLEKVLALEKPDGLMVAFGGQAGLNLGYILIAKGVLQKNPTQMLGINEKILAAAEDRGRFVEIMTGTGLKTPSGVLVKEFHEGLTAAKKYGYPLVIRTPFAPEGCGVNIAFNQEESADYLEKGLSVSPNHAVWLEESLLHWREFEVEAVRDQSGQCLLVAVLEKVEPCGIHSGDSVMVTPSQTLTADQLTVLAGGTEKALNALGVVGGANIQWIFNPDSGEIRILRVNPRFTRSAALVSHSTGFPIAAVTAKLMTGMNLAQAAKLPNLPADHIFRPGDNVVAVRIPRFDFAKFPEAAPVLTATMKSTGDVFALGCTFKEAFQKAIRALDTGYYGFGSDRPDPDEVELPLADLKAGIANPGPGRLFKLRLGLKRGLSPAELAKITRIDAWFIREMAEFTGFEKKLSTYALYNLDPKVLLQAKQWGYSDFQLAYLLRSSENELRQARLQTGIIPGYRSVRDAMTQEEICRYSCYDLSDDINEAEEGKRVLVAGSGPSRIGQGLEYDYCVALAVRTLLSLGFKPIYVNCVPGSGVFDFNRGVITYCEPLTTEDLLNILAKEKPEKVITHFSGAKEAVFIKAFREHGMMIENPAFEGHLPIIQERLKAILADQGIALPGAGEAHHLGDAMQIAARVGFPLLLRPEISSEQQTATVVYQAEGLSEIWDRTVKGNKLPVYVEHIPDNAIGIQLNGLGDGKELIAAAVIEQIEEAIVDIGDSACTLPAYTVGKETIDKLKTTASRLVSEFNIRGILTIRFSIKHNTVYWGGITSGISQLLPFIIKATGTDWIATATQVLLDHPVGNVPEQPLHHTAIREAVFNFENFPGMDALLGPEQRSTGSVIGLDRDFGLAFIKSQLAAGENLPATGNIYLNIRDEDKRAFVAIARQLIELGFSILATDELAQVLRRSQIACREVARIGEGRPDILDQIKNGAVQWVINTPAERRAKREEALIRSTAVARGIPITTTLSGAQAAVSGLERYRRFGIQPREWTEYFGEE